MYTKVSPSFVNLSICILYLSPSSPTDIRQYHLHHSGDSHGIIRQGMSPTIHLRNTSVFIYSLICIDLVINTIDC